MDGNEMMQRQEMEALEALNEDMASLRRAVEWQATQD